VKGFKILYTVLRIWLSGRLPRAPLDRRASVDIVPVDYVVNAALALAEDESAQFEVINLCAGDAAPSPVAVANHAFRVFELPNPKYAPQWFANILRLRWLRPFMGYALAEIVDMMHWHIPYLGSRRRVFDTSKAQMLLQKHDIGCPQLESYGDAMFRFCKDSHWGKKSLSLKG
jgi:nucleoside-diphosphate-sugar epimerase